MHKTEREWTKHHNDRLNEYDRRNRDQFCSFHCERWAERCDDWREGYYAAILEIRRELTDAGIIHPTFGPAF